MNQIENIKQALSDMSSKTHAISKEARYAKERHTLEEIDISKQAIEKHKQFQEEFNTSISLLMSIFKQSKFDSVLGMAADPLRLVLLNFFIAFFRGIGFIFGVIVVLFILYACFWESLQRLWLT